jgi:predicted TIM-barrel fold metal-dependent hydrolase
MTPTCPGPRAEIGKPTWRPPARSVDCHMHVFGPYGRHPLSPGRSYTPPEAGVAAYGAVRGALGLERTIVVQPSVYGDDNTVTLEAASALGPAGGAVVVVGPRVTDGELRSLDERGARALRFNAVSGNGTPLDALEPLAERIRPMGWHVEIYCREGHLAALEPVVERLPVPVVFDHMGGVRAEGAAIPSGPFAALLRMLRRGAWVKLCGYRSSRGYPYDDVLPMARAIVDAAPTRCVWGTDWPHPALPRPEDVPDDAHLLTVLSDWVPNAEQRHAILVENPARLYRL